MVSTVTTKVPLGPTTLNRKWYLDVNTGTFATPIWTGVFGVTDFKPINNGDLQDDSDFDGGGYKSQVQTAIEWGIELKVKRAVTTASPTAYDPGQEVLRLASLGLGTGNSVDTSHPQVRRRAPSRARPSAASRRPAPRCGRGRRVAVEPSARAAPTSRRARRSAWRARNRWPTPRWR